MPLRLGTRRSALALAQSGMVARALGDDVELVEVVTEGDRLVDVPLQGSLAKGYFTEALEAGLREGRFDLAVHSLKDLPVAAAPGLVLGAIPPRESVADLLLIRREVWESDAERIPLRLGASVGAASLRRQALVRSLRPDLEPRFLRGNVTTRLQRLVEGRFDAIVLAEAGVCRLGAALGLDALHDVVIVRLLPEHWPPAPGQGALALQCRADDEALRGRLTRLHDAEAAAAVGWERAALAAIGGGCSTPFAAWWSGDRGVLGMERAGQFRLRRGLGAHDQERDAALALLTADGPGEGWPFRVWSPWSASLTKPLEVTL